MTPRNQGQEAAIKGIVVGGTHSGAGKTTIALGLMAALTARGYTVAPRRPPILWLPADDGPMMGRQKKESPMKPHEDATGGFDIVRQWLARSVVTSVLKVERSRRLKAFLKDKDHRMIGRFHG